MSVIVKGRNMPRHCGECACSNYYDQLDALLCDFTEKQLDEKTWKKERHPDCPLVELPPHGRLIDIRSVEDEKFVTVGNDYQRWWNGALESVIDNAPTVIEGSET